MKLEDYAKMYNLEDSDFNPYVKNKILKFRVDSKGNVSANYLGKPVFQDRNSDDDFKPGETWICKVDMSRDNYYFAKSIAKVDGSFFYDLNRDQMEELAETVLKNHRDMIEPLLEEKYKNVMVERISDAVMEKEAELVEQINELEAHVNELEKKDVENRQIISSLQNKLDTCEAMGAKRSVSETVSPSADVFTGGVPVVHITRDNPDELTSEQFNRPRYFAHFSADQRILLIRPHDEGNVVCMDNRIQLLGLSKISSFDGPVEMVAEYAPEYGGFVVRL